MIHIEQPKRKRIFRHLLFKYKPHIYNIIKALFFTGFAVYASSIDNSESAAAWAFAVIAVTILTWSKNK